MKNNIFSVNIKSIYLFFPFAIFFVLAFSVLIVSGFVFEKIHFFDDSYMFVRYAKNVLAGYGEAWNFGERPSYGNTSQTHFVIVLFLTWLGYFSDQNIVKISSLIPALIFLFWVPWFALRHSGSFLNQSSLWRYCFWLSLLGPIIYLHMPYRFHSATGMDTFLSMLMHLFLIDSTLTYIKTRKNSFWIGMILFAFLAYATRPENIICAAMFPVLYMGLYHKLYKESFVFLVFLGGAVLLDLIWKYLYFGDIFPLAFYSKKSGFFEGYTGLAYSHPIMKIFQFLIDIWPLLLIQALVFKKRHLFSIVVFLLPALLTISYFFTMMTIMNLGARYYFPFSVYLLASVIFHSEFRCVEAYHNTGSTGGKLKFLQYSIFVACALALYAFIVKEMTFGGMKYMVMLYSVGLILFCLLICGQKLKDTFKARQVLIFIILVGVYGLFQKGDENAWEITQVIAEPPQPCEVPILEKQPGYPPVERARTLEGIYQISDMLKRAPAGTVLAATEYGFVSAQNPHIKILDVIGLHNSHVAHNGFSAEWFYDNQVDAIWIPHWHYTCLNEKLTSDPRFKSDYKYYPEIFSWGFALNTKGPNFKRLYDLTDREVRKIYPGYRLKSFEKTWEN